MRTININTLEMDRQVFWQKNLLILIENKRAQLFQKNKIPTKSLL